MNLKEKGLEAVDWIHLPEDVEQWLAVVNAVVNLWVSWKEDIPWLVAISFSKRTPSHWDSIIGGSSILVVVAAVAIVVVPVVNVVAAAELK